MCGIAGIIGPGASPERIRRMTDAQRHRGPDDEGLVVLPTGLDGPPIGLGHRRLAILDLSPAGHQPMKDPEGDSWIVFNGEIFNHLDLRRDLGGAFRSTCDTETLLVAFRRWGRHAVDRLRGMFAFALWDPSARELLLCRDRLGVKPLYYAEVGPDFVFASELRGLLASGLVPPRLDRDGVDGFLAFGHVPEPGTIVRGVRLLEAGHWMRVSPDRGIVEDRRYWAAPYRGEPDASEPPASAVRRLVGEAVECRLLSDVPLGAFLSGGIDSGAIVATMARLNHPSIRTFTLHFAEAGYGEGPQAEALAARHNTQHTTETVAASDLLARFDDALDAADQPSIDGINTHYVCDLARKSGLTVALCGHGGDELFGGYDNFRLLPRVLRLAAIPRPIRAAMGRAAERYAPTRVATRKASSLLEGRLDAHHAYALARSVFWDGFREGLLDRPSEMVPAVEPVLAAVPPGEAAREPFNQVSQFELSFYLRNSLLRDADVCSMAHALELRVPLLDHKLVEHVAPLPGRLKASRARPKRLLVEAMGDDLPREVSRRRKQGFVIPYEVWMRGALRPRIEAVLTDGDLCRGVGIRPVAVARVWSDFLSGSEGLNMQHPLALYVLLRWSSRMGVTL